MLLVALLIGVILIVAAVRNSYQDLFSNLGHDAPGFVIWAAAIVALGAIGFVPGLKPISRALVVLVVIVIVLRNYAQILSGLMAGANPASANDNAAPTTLDTTAVAPDMNSNDFSAVFAQLAHAPDLSSFGGTGNSAGGFGSSSAITQNNFLSASPNDATAVGLF